MAYGTTGYSPVAKRRTDDADDKPSPGPAFDRVEFQAPPGWVEKLDAAAEALGMSRSAYIRMACNRQMKADAKEDSDP